MFGLSWEQIILIVLAALFLLGPERIPAATRWLIEGLRKIRTFASGAQSELQSQFGDELAELRAQVAELKSFKELQELRDMKELRDLRDLDPRRMIGKTLLGDQFSGGVTGFLGLTGTEKDSASAAAAAANTAAAGALSTGPSAGGSAVHAAGSSTESTGSGDSNQGDQSAWSDVT